MEKILLGEVLSEIVDKTTVNNQYEVLTSSQKGIFSQEEYFTKQIASQDNVGYKIIRKGEFTYRSMSDTGAFYINRLTNKEIGIVSPAYPVFKISSPKIIPEYLELYFQSSFFQHQISNKSTGSTRLALKFGKLCSLIIPMPDVNAQKKIVEEIDDYKKLIAKTEKEITLMDELVKSRFIEMFDGKGYPLKSGKDLFKFSSGKFLEANKRFDNGIPVYGGNGIAWYTDDSLVNEDTIVIGRVGAYCGNVRLVREQKWITDNALYISKFKTDDFELEFLEQLMIHYDFHQYAGAAAQPKITQKPLEEQMYLVPPRDEQIKYTELVKQIDKSKFNVQKHLAIMQELLSKKMDEYFN